MKDILNKFTNEEQVKYEFKSKISEILDYIKKFSIYDVLVYFYFDYKISYGEMNTKDERWLKSKKILYLQILFSCVGSRKCKNKELKECDFKKIEKFLEELEKITKRYELVSEQNDKLTEEEKDYIIHSEAFKDWNGKRYDIFEVQHHKDLLTPMEKEFLKVYNFTLNDLYAGISKLKNNIYFEFENSINNFNTMLKKEKIKLNDNGIATLPEGFDEGKKEKLEKYYNNIFSLELANIQKNTNWTTSFLDKFIIDTDEYKKFIEDINIKAWNDIINKIKYKPLIKINNEYYILLQQQFYDNFDKIAIQGICENIGKENEQELRAKYTSNIEKVVATYFKNILDTEQIYMKNYYDYNKKIIENDILAIYDNNIFIIEVKAGSFTPELASEDFESHKRSLEDLVKKANEQQDILEKCLIERKKVIFYDGNNKKNRNKKVDIIINKDTKIFKIIITAESFNDIEARIDKVKIVSLSNNTLVFCLDDLRVYSEYFYKHPCYFIQYLQQRKKAIGNKNIDLVDELYHLGMWIQYNYYNEYTNEMLRSFAQEEGVEEFGVVSIAGEDWMEELDAYYNNLWFKKRDVTKPFRKLPLEIEKIISYCERNNKIKNHTYFTTFLLNLNPNVQQQTEKIILQSKEFYKKNNRPKYRIYGFSAKR